MKARFGFLLLCTSLLISSEAFSFGLFNQAKENEGMDVALEKLGEENFDEEHASEEILFEEDELEIPSRQNLAIIRATHPSTDDPEADTRLFFYEDTNQSLPILDTAVFLVGEVDGKAPQIWPVNGIITSNYGVRRGGKVVRRGGKKRRVIYSRHHAGIDIAAPIGSPIVAPGKAVVSFVGVKNGYGNVVILDHGNGISSLYAHAHALFVQLGQEVSKGDLIATVGSTGRSTGPHLHFEIRKSGSTVNPMAFIKGRPQGGTNLAQNDSESDEANY